MALRDGTVTMAPRDGTVACNNIILPLLQNRTFYLQQQDAIGTIPFTAAGYSIQGGNRTILFTVQGVSHLQQQGYSTPPFTVTGLFYLQYKVQ